MKASELLKQFAFEYELVGESNIAFAGPAGNIQTIQPCKIWGHYFYRAEV